MLRERVTLRAPAESTVPTSASPITGMPESDAPVLGQLLDVLGERMDQAQLEELMRTVGRRLAPERVEASGGTNARLEAAVAFLNELGGLAELEERNGNLVIRGYSCPLAAVTRGRPEVCELDESLLCQLTGLPIRSTAIEASNHTDGSRLRAAKGPASDITGSRSRRIMEAGTLQR